MSHDRRGSIAAECPPDYFPWMHFCSVDGALEQLYVFDQPVTSIQEGSCEDFPLESSQLVLKERLSYFRIRESCPSLHPLACHSPCGLDDLVRICDAISLIFAPCV